MDRRCFLKTTARASIGVGLSRSLVARAMPPYSGVEKPTEAHHPGGREVVTQEFAIYPPLFAMQANTLDPTAMARIAWEGYLTSQPDPWGMQLDGQPTLRFHFDNRALPWPSLKHHNVDGFDNNSRNMGAHALLHEMFGGEKNGDLSEQNQLAYLVSITDSQSGFAYDAESLPRMCPLGLGELAKNLMLLYQQTNQKALRDWAEKMTMTLRRYAVVKNRPGVGLVAAYCQGGRGGQLGFVVGERPITVTKDNTIEVWQHLFGGGGVGAFSKWYELTGDSSALDFAVALANRLCNSEDPNGDDGSFRPDGSFGGKSQASPGSWHMHSHTHCLPGLLHLGNQLINANRPEEGLAMIEQARRSFEWLYDPVRNPDAGSQTGWLGEWLILATGWPRKTDCEGCTMGDAVQTAVGLGAVAHRHPDLTALSSYYDRAEQIYRGEVVEQMFQVTPRYLEVVRGCLEKSVAKDKSISSDMREHEVERRFVEAKLTAERMIGQQRGLSGLSDWVNDTPSDLDSELPGIHMQSCCADATIRAAHAIWSQTVTGDETEVRVNMAFNRVSPWVEVVSCLPHRGEVNIVVRQTRRVLVRVPEWAPKGEVRCYREKKPTYVTWVAGYVVFDNVAKGEQLTVVYPLRLWQMRETVYGVAYSEKWRGNTIVDLAPQGKWIPMFQRPELETERV
jgi:hypothetical protein